MYFFFFLFFSFFMKPVHHRLTPFLILIQFLTREKDLGLRSFFSFSLKINIKSGEAQSGSRSAVYFSDFCPYRTEKKTQLPLISYADPVNSSRGIQHLHVINRKCKLLSSNWLNSIRNITLIYGCEYYFF